jgi:cysteine desulfuration protein SufE
MDSILDIQKKLIEDFSFFDTWEERYEYIIQLGKELPFSKQSSYFHVL